MVFARSRVRVSCAAWCAGVVLALSGAPALAFDALPWPPGQSVGVLPLLTVFGDVPCSGGAVPGVALYARPGDTSPVGTLRVSGTPYALPGGPCHPGQVVVQAAGQPADTHAAATEYLPTLEYGHEVHGAIVMARQGQWCQLWLHGRTAWLRQGCARGFVPMPSLLRQSLLRLKPAALALATRTPDGAPAAVPGAWLAPGRPQVQWLDSREVRGRVWVHLAVSLQPICEQPGGKPGPVRRVWLPAVDAHGEWQLWMFARGC